MQLVTRSLSDVQVRPVSWLWPGRVPRGKVTMLAGDPGLGKSFMTMDLAARVTVNADLPDVRSPFRTPGSVLVLSAEDDAADTIRPRIEAAGGDPSRVTIVDGVRAHAGAAGTSGLRLDLDLPAVEQHLAAMERPRLIVIDPISAYLGEVDSHSNAQVRGLLADLSRLAASYGPAVLCVSHLNKSAGGKAVYRMMGSLAFTAAARIVWQIERHPDDDTRRVMVLVKSNLDAKRTGLSYRLEDGRVRWDERPVELEACALESEGGVGGPGWEPPARGEAAAAEFLVELLAQGPMGATEVMARAEEAGHAERAVRRAKARLSVLSRRPPGAEARWEWSLPGVRGAAADAAAAE